MIYIYACHLFFFVPLQAGAGLAPAYESQYQQQPYYPEEQPSSSPVSLEQYQGTVFPSPNFQVEADCQALTQAMRGLGE